MWSSKKMSTTRSGMSFCAEWMRSCRSRGAADAARRLIFGVGAETRQGAVAAPLVCRFGTLQEA
jgi:hypothetical protein